MQEPATVTATQEEDRINLLIETSDAGLLIGKQGQTLDALQYLITKMLAKQTRKQGQGRHRRGSLPGPPQ